MGCASFIFKMSTFTKADKVLEDVLDLLATVEEEGTGMFYIHVALKYFSQFGKLCNMEVSCTGILQSQVKEISISYVVGQLSFIDTPKIYSKGSNVQGKVSIKHLHFVPFISYIQWKMGFWEYVCFQQVIAVDYYNAPVPEKSLYLFEGEMWSSRLLQNLTTNKNGVATFSFGTSKYSGNIQLYVSVKHGRENTFQPTFQ